MDEFLWLANSIRQDTIRVYHVSALIVIKKRLSAILRIYLR
jgi:hypothetical protein